MEYKDTEKIIEELKKQNKLILGVLIVNFIFLIFGILLGIIMLVEPNIFISK